MILKMLIFHSFKASGLTFSYLHQRLLKSFKEAAISLRHFGKSNIRGKSIFRTIRNNIANSSVKNGMYIIGQF